MFGAGDGKSCFDLEDETLALCPRPDEERREMRACQI